MIQPPEMLALIALTVLIALAGLPCRRGSIQGQARRTSVRQPSRLLRWLRAWPYLAGLIAQKPLGRPKRPGALQSPRGRCFLRPRSR